MIRASLFASVAAYALYCAALPLPAEELPKTIGSIERLAPEFDKLVPKDAKIEVLAGDFEWSEGPVWIKDGGYLLFSDIPRNHIVKWKAGEGTSVFLQRSGYTGKKPFTGSEPGSNGLMLDSKGRLVICCHGDRAVKRLNENGKAEVLVDSFEGKRLNSPNDLVFHSNGDLYFTDPPYGLPQRFDDPARELDFCGVYRLSKNGTLRRLTKEMDRPNGIAFSPDYKTLYVAQSFAEAPIWKSFPVKEDGTLGKGKLFHDARELFRKQPGICDGMCVDLQGNVWATGPGGVWVFNSDGKLLGRIFTGQRTANCTFGEDGKTLFITADMYLCRVRTNSTGMGY